MGLGNAVSRSNMDEWIMMMLICRIESPLTHRPHPVGDMVQVGAITSISSSALFKVMGDACFTVRVQGKRYHNSSNLHNTFPAWPSGTYTTIKAEVSQLCLRVRVE